MHLKLIGFGSLKLMRDATINQKKNKWYRIFKDCRVEGARKFSVECQYIPQVCTRKFFVFKKCVNVINEVGYIVQFDTFGEAEEFIESLYNADRETKVIEYDEHRN